jgi:hypothetical protein
MDKGDDNELVQQGIEAGRDAIGALQVSGKNNVIKQKIIINQRDSAEDSEGEYGYEEDWVVRTIDHLEQRDEIASSFESTGNKNDRAYFQFDATPDDWPRAFADHVYLQFTRLAPETDGLATGLRRSGLGPQAIWKALLQKIPGGRELENLADQQKLVLDWIDSRQLTVLYVVVDADREDSNLAEMVDGACSAIDALPGFRSGVRLMLLFACLKAGEGSKPSVLRRLTSLFGNAKPGDRCCALPPLRMLNRVDVEDWLSGFTAEQTNRYRKGVLRTELAELLKDQDQPYEILRNHLVTGGALYRARVSKAVSADNN